MLVVLSKMFMEIRANLIFFFLLISTALFVGLDLLTVRIYDRNDLQKILTGLTSHMMVLDLTLCRAAAVL